MFGLVCYEKLFSLNKNILQNFFKNDLSKQFLQIDLVDIFDQSKKKQCQSLGLEFRKIIIEDGGRVQYGILGIRESLLSFLGSF